MNTIAYEMRPSDWILDRVLNPAGDPDFNQAAPDRLLEACGIIPDFFAEACVTAEDENPEGFTLQDVAAGMDRIYQFGGFAYPWPGTLDADGVYYSKHEEDPPLSPLVRFSFMASHSGRIIECFVYQSAITSIRERSGWRSGTASLFIGRFD